MLTHDTSHGRSYEIGENPNLASRDAAQGFVGESNRYVLTMSNLLQIGLVLLTTCSGPGQVKPDQEPVGAAPRYDP